MELNMLRNIDPILSPELLYALRAMGHGDDILIADANYPGESAGPICIRADGLSGTDILRAILTIMPLDTFVDDPAITMQVVDDSGKTPEVVAEYQKIIREVADNPVDVVPMERFAFYERANQAYALVQTGERRLYGNILLKKGVIQPD